MHRLMTRLVRQKQLNEAYVVSDDALDAFKVKDSTGSVPAKVFLEAEIKRLAPLQEASSDSIEKKPQTLKRNDTVAAPLRPDQIRPQSQASLFQFEPSAPTPAESAKLRRNMDVVLNAADEEIKSLNEVRGAGEVVYVDHRESRSTLPTYLNGLGFETTFTQLPCGDFRLSERVLIERKSARDLLESVKSGRLLSQCRSLVVSAQRPLLLVETGEKHNTVFIQMPCLEHWLTSRLNWAYRWSWSKDLLRPPTSSPLPFAKNTKHWNACINLHRHQAKNCLTFVRPWHKQAVSLTQSWTNLRIHTRGSTTDVNTWSVVITTP